MKSLIKNDDAISVVVGAILILAVMVTFMSVFTSSWVPIYEGDAEADHSDTTQRTFMDLYKQIESAEKTTNSVTIDLGTDDMSFVKNSYSVGYLEVNQSSGAMYLTTDIINPPLDNSAAGYGLPVLGMDNTGPHPITKFAFDFSLIDPSGSNSPKKIENFMIQFRTSTLNRWISIYPDGNPPTGPSNNKMIIYVRSNSTTDEKWSGSSSIKDNQDPDLTYDLATRDFVHVNLLSENITLDLKKPIGENVYFNETNRTFNTNDIYTATLNDVIQHYMRMPGDGTGGDYFIDYIQFSGVFEGEQYFDYDKIYGTDSDSNTTYNPITSFDNGTKFGGGTLTMKSDYNFMVDQSYIYENGAVFLSQYDGEVFKVAPPIVALNDNGILSMSLNGVVLNGDLQASGNGVETISTTISNVRVVSGKTNRIMIEKETTKDYYDFWMSLFEDVRSIADNCTNINATLTNNTANTNMTLIITDTNSTENIKIFVDTKVITIS